MREAHLEGVEDFVAGDVASCSQAFARFHEELTVSQGCDHVAVFDREGEGLKN